MKSNGTAQIETAQLPTGSELYAFVWRWIKEIAPGATLLRGSDNLNPAVCSISSDIDILVPANLDLVKTFLVSWGFYRVFKPNAYLERFRLRFPGDPVPYTIDLYSTERWGSGFRYPASQSPVENRTACLFHAVLDSKGTTYFEEKHGGPPWRNPQHGDPKFGLFGRALWHWGHTSPLTLYLLVKGVVVPDLSMILRTLCRRIAHRTWQLIKKTGLEVALLGVDGTGKSSLAAALSSLPASVKVIYMGPHDYQTRTMRFFDRHKSPLFMWQLAFRFDLLVRRFYGWLFARRGWIVIYDRHPAERLDPRRRSLRNRVKDFIDRSYAWPVDLTFWLTGDYRALYFRKMEVLPNELRAIDERFQSILAHYHIPFEMIDVTRNDLNSVRNLIAETILAKHQERISIKSVPALIRTALV